jgi:phenylalanine-4-hydroxylase
VEFGLVKENNKMKFYGGGIASSVDEINNAMSCKDLRPLRLYEERPPVDFIIEDVQPFFYYIER